MNIFSCGETDTKTSKPKEKETVLETKKIEFDIAKCAESKVEILKPKDWHFYKSASVVGYAYYITPYVYQDLGVFKSFNSLIKKRFPYVYQDLGVFKRGLSLIVVNNVTRETSLSPSQKMEQFIENAKTIEKNLQVKRSEMPNMLGASFLVKDPAGTPESLISSIFIIANDKEDTLYTFVFQYERKDWDEMQPICKAMLKNIKITSEGF